MWEFRVYCLRKDTVMMNTSVKPSLHYVGFVREFELCSGYVKMLFERLAILRDMLRNIGRFCQRISTCN